MKRLKEVMSVGGGGLAGLNTSTHPGDNPEDIGGREPDRVRVNRRRKRKRKRKRIHENMETFAGCPVFSLASDEYQNCMHGRERYERWNNKLNMENIDNQGIRSYVHKNPGQPIVVKDSTTGIMAYLVPPTNKGTEE